MQSASIIQGKESAEKTARSIFVGNIPYEATEEKLVELFSKVSFLVIFLQSNRLGLLSAFVWSMTENLASQKDTDFANMLTRLSLLVLCGTCKILNLMDGLCESVLLLANRTRLKLL